MDGPRVVVVGGSVAGLSAALFLARRGHPVTVLEKDPTPAPDELGAVGGWRRSATPQSGHSHAFLAGARSLLAREAPDVLDLLRAAGVRETPLRPPATALGRDLVGSEGAEELVVLNARRSTFEWALRTVVAAEPDVDLRIGVGAEGLRVEGRRPGRVVGVDTVHGLVPATVVVDAAGKRSPVRGWASADPGDRQVACGISYLTRFYRLRGDDPTPLGRGFTHGASFDRYSCLVFPADAGTFSITFGVLPEDRDVRVLRAPDAFDAAVASIPLVAPWVDRDVAEPISDVASMAALKNILRARPADAPRGLHTIGDALSVTNPAHTRGTTLALATARVLADAVDAHPGDAEAQAEVLDHFTDEVLAAWVEDSVGQDADRLARWRPAEEPEPARHRHALSNGQAYLAAQRRAEVWFAFTRLQNTLATPAEVLDDPDVVGAHVEVAASGWRPEPATAPSHDELVDLGRRCATAA